MTDKTEDVPQNRLGSQIEIRADNNSTAIGTVGQLAISDVQAVAIGRVGSISVVAPQPLRTTTTVLPISAMRSSPATFVGRRGQIDVLSAFLLEPDPRASLVAVVVGSPGVGKTALVRHVALNAVDKKHFVHALFADLRGYEEVAADRVQASEMFGALLQGLGIPSAQMSESASERARLYHQTLDEHAAAGRSVLIWLDNVGDRSQIVGLIPANPIHRTIVTTRDTFPSGESRLSIELDVLPIKDSIELLRREIQIDGGDFRVDADLEASSRLAELCDRLPLALQIISSLIADEPSRAIQEFVSEMRAEEHRLDTLHYDDRLSVRAAIALSYKRLPENLQRLFRLLSQVPGGDVGIDAARWLIDADAAAVRPQLRALVRSHLVQQHVDNRWSMHDLVRIFASELAAQHEEDAANALRNLVQRYSVTIVLAFEWITAVASGPARAVFQNPTQAATWFEAERSTAVAIVKAIADRDGYENICVELGVALGDLLRSQKHWHADFFAIAATTAALATRLPPQLVAASALSNFGTSLRMQRKYADCRKALEESVAMFESLGDPDRASGARSNIANLLQEQGQYDEAIAIYRKDLQQCPPSTHPHPAAGTLTNLGAVLVTVGRPGEGVTQLLQAVVLCRKLKDLSGLGSALRNLGGAYIALSDQNGDVRAVLKAIAALEEARRVSADLLDSEGAANAANNLAVALCSIRKFEEGIALFGSALEYYDQTGQVGQANRTRWHRDQARKAANLM